MHADESSRIACLDIHSPLYLRTNESKYGGGDIEELYELVERASNARFGLIEMTPIQDTGLNPCPYMGLSLFSYNPIYISVERIPETVKAKKIIRDKIDQNVISDLVDYQSLYRFKESVLRETFLSNRVNIDFNNFDRNQLAYAVFKVLQEKFGQEWNKWPRHYKSGNVSGIIRKHKELHEEIKFILFCQQVLEKQWKDLVEFAEERGVSFIMDKPIYPSINSADVWANRDLFYFKSANEPKYISGANLPGDPFGEQIWGHAVYQFREKPDKVIKFFDQSIAFLAKTSSVIRLDHALAYVWKYYIYNPGLKTGKYLPGLGDRLFKGLKKKFPKICFIAEDAGYVSEKEVDEPLMRYGIPGIRCLQWGSKRNCQFDEYPKLSMAVTANHDTDSLQAWLHNSDGEQRDLLYQQFKRGIGECDEDWELIRLVFKSSAMIASVTLRDIIGDIRRFNFPGTDNSQNWRLYCPLSLEKINFQRIRKIIIDSKRVN